MDYLAVVPLAALITGALAQAVLGRVLTPRAKGWLAFAFGLLALFGVLSMIPSIGAGIPLNATLLNWDRGITLALHIDGLSLMFALMATGIGSAILLYCVDYMAHEPAGTTRFYILMLVFIAGLVGLVSSANLLIAYLCWEVIGLCSYFLVGFWYKEEAAANGARKVLLMTHLPGYALLIAILILFQHSGTLLWTDPALAQNFTTGIFILMLLAAMAKSVMFPLHTWIPEAMNAPTPVSALLHSACYVKAGVYLVARFYSLNQASLWPTGWSTLVLAIGCVTMLVGALFALAQTDLKRLLAFSTISQLGYIITGIGLNTPFGLAAGLFYCFSHGLFKGTLFLVAGAVQHETGTRDMNKLGGLARRMPNTARVWLVAAAAIIGVPLTNGFIAKLALFDAAINGGQWAVVVIAWLVSVISAFYILKATVSIFFGDQPAWLTEKHIQDAPSRMLAGMGFLALLCLVFGIYPQALFRWVVQPAAEMMLSLASGQLGRYSLPLFGADAPALAGIALVLVPVLLAGIVYLLTRPVKTEREVPLFTGGDPLIEGNAGAEDFADLAETQLEPIYAMTNPDPVYLRIWRAIRWLGNQAAWVFAPLDRRPILASLAFIVIIAAAVWLR